MTGGMSGTVESARQAAQMTDADVTVIDSRFIAIGLAIQLREAIRMRDEGATVEALKYRKKETKFVRFPEANHELSRSGKPTLRINRLEYIRDWFVKYL